MDRKFGIELEIVGITRQVALRALRAVGINVQDESYNHTTRGHWKLVSDSSVRDGFEVVSPILQGEAGIEEAMTVAEALSDAGATVNRSCGFHVHFDAADLNAADVKIIVNRYAAHEAEIDAFMPPSRRGNTNTYCESVTSFLNRRFNEARTINELAAAQPGRYFKVNLQSYRRHGTLEFRQHSGTVNANKVANWVRFLGEFIEQCKRPAAPTPAAPAAELPAVPGMRGVQARLAEMFASQGTVSLAAMCERFGWQAHSARAAVTRLRRAGMRIAPVKLDGQAAYRLENGRTPAAPVAPETLWTGISESVITFYRRRAAVLAAAV
ncbi:amidoligase family protein [uncultured Desulfovibrio sp.]|uniref:amidoligase family protein n=1 Tax=uncultured Desulfovibrio sp. TaxID=167968 RepID=UPI0026309C38|nr:amidoligase family protein [uncultured Desulfovibrio sp.]